MTGGSGESEAKNLPQRRGVRRDRKRKTTDQRRKGPFPPSSFTLQTSLFKLLLLFLIRSLRTLRRVQRLKPGASDWFDVGMAFEEKIELAGQERGLEFSYRVVSSNKAGSATPSNTVMAVL